MAQMDTGLGWSAKDTYLMALIGEFAAFSSIGGSSYPGQPIPKAQTATDLRNNGFHIAESNRFNRYCGSDPDHNVLVAVTSYSNTNITRVYISDTPATVYELAAGAGTVDTMQIVDRDPTTGLYYHRVGNTWGNNPRPTDLVVYAPVFSNIDAALAAVSGSSTKVFKMNEGFAVACVATWFNTLGDTITAPILISTNSSYIIMSLDGVTPASQTRISVLYNGVYFYMSYITGLEGDPTGYAPIIDLRQFAAATPEKVFRLIADESFANILILDAPDPYENEGGSSEEDGGGGSEDEDEPVDEETLPLPSVAGLGFCTIYVPTDSDLLSLSQYLWGGNLDLDTFLKLFSNPMDSILGLSAVPVSLPGSYGPVYMGGQILENVSLPRYTGRTSVKVDMGTVTIGERWGSYLDYDPYTEFSIYLPFVGIKNIKADDIMKKTISLMYSIDILSGACVAYIRPSGGSVLYEWSGQCALQIPITGANWDNIFRTAVSTAAAIGGAFFAPVNSPVTSGAIASAAVQAVSAKPRIERSGAVNGITGFLGQLRPYIIRVNPEAYIPADQNKFIGYPSYITAQLSTLTGYNEIASIHLENIPATGNELSEIETLLKGGVIF